MKIVVAGASTYGVDNMGDDAMLSCLIRGIKQADPKAEITFLARHPDPEFDKIFGFHGIQNLDHPSTDAARGRIFLGFNAGDSRENLRHIRLAMAEADLLIIGGNSLMEISENTFLRGVSTYATTLASFALFMGKQYALFGLNIVNPIKSPFVASQAKFLIENAAISTVRENEVVDYLREAGVDTSNVVVAGDPAYGVDLDRAADYDGRDILKREGIVLDTSKHTVSLCLREEYWRSDEASLANLGQETCAVMRHVLARDDTQILFIPNCHYEKAHPLADDRLINKGIRKRFGDNPRVHYIQQKLNLYETLAIFPLTHLHISNRRHSNIFAALFGKPFIPISVTLKTHISAFVKDLDQSEMLVSCQHFSKEVAEKFDYSMKHHAEISKRLSSAVAVRRAAGLVPASRLTDLLIK